MLKGLISYSDFRFKHDKLISWKICVVKNQRLQFYDLKS